MSLDPIPLAVMGGLWVFFLWQPYMRTLRSIAFLTAMSAGLIAAYFLPSQVGQWAQALVIAATAMVLVFFYRPFLTLPAPDVAFLEALDATNQRLQNALTSFEEDPSSTQDWRRSLEAAVAEVSALQPPDITWAAVKSGALALLRRRIELLEQEAVSVADRQEFARQREALHGRIELARHRRRSAWRLRS